MNPEAEIAIGGVVGVVAKLVMYGTTLTGKYASLASILITTVVFLIWAYSHNDYTRESTWTYFVAWANVNLIAAGAFHATEEAMKKAGKE